MIDFKKLIANELEEQNDQTSHFEPKPNVFHPSQLAYKCNYQTYLSKLCIENHSPETLGRFRTGTMIHKWIEYNIGYDLDKAHWERSCRKRYDNDIILIGNTDCLDFEENAVYDFKSRASWYNFSPPNDRHMRQLNLYMDIVGAEKGQIVYINKGDFEVKTYPKHTFEDFDPQVVRNLKIKAGQIRDIINEQGYPTCVDEIPYEPCGCWICDNTNEETFEFGHLENID